MRRLRNALLAACAIGLPLAVAAQARADQTIAPRIPPGGIMLYTADGMPVGMLTPVQSAPREIVATEPDAVSIAQIMARQDEMMDRMFARMRAMFDMPMGFGAAGVGATDMFAFPGAGGGLSVSTLSGGHGICGESVTYTFDGRNAQPTVHVRKIGDACGALEAPGERTTPAAVERAPRAPDVVPVAPRSSERTYDIMYRHPAAPAPEPAHF